MCLKLIGCIKITGGMSMYIYIVCHKST